MKNKKNVIILCLIALVAVGTCVFIFDKKYKKNYMEKHIEPEKITINVWTKDRHDLEFWSKKVEEYNRNNPDNITVKYQVFSDNYFQSVENAMDTANLKETFQRL